MFKFIFIIAINLFTCFGFKRKMKKALKNKNLTKQEKYDVARGVAKTIKEKAHVTIEVTGLEYTKGEQFVLFSNHQGRFDGLAIVNAVDDNFSILVDETRSHVSLEEYFLNLTGCVRIDKTNARNAYTAMKELEQRVINGENFLIFPEGYYKDNKNTLQELNTGCMHFLKASKVRIIPVCLYDTYTVYNDKFKWRNNCSVDFLKPIYYEEYKDLSLKEIAELIKSRIQEQIDYRDNLK